MSTRPACQSALCPLSRKSSPGNVHHSRESASRNSRALETRQRDRMNYRSGHGGQKYEATSPPWKQTPNLRSQKLCVKSEHLRTFETRAEELAASCPLTGGGPCHVCVFPQRRLWISEHAGRRQHQFPVRAW